MPQPGVLCCNKLHGLLYRPMPCLGRQLLTVHHLELVSHFTVLWLTAEWGFGMVVIVFSQYLGIFHLSVIRVYALAYFWESLLCVTDVFCIILTFIICLTI